jgi:endonuclease III
MYGPKYQLALSNQPKLFSNYRANFVWIMSSLRRSSRRTTTPVHVASAAADTVIVDGQTALTAATTLKEETKAMVIKKESKRSISTTTITKKNVKRVKKEELTDNAGEPPKNWDIIYDKLEAYREINKAAVDTMGCERLADRAKTPQIQRFQTLVSLMLSAQTKDTVTSVAVIKLQTELPGGLCLESILKVDERVLDDMIKAVGFHTKKAAYIKRTSEILRDQYNGDIPDTIEGLTSLPGVGPKMGYLTLQVAWNKNLGIGVDVHVHRISNRLGWVKTKNPEETRLVSCVCVKLIISFFINSYYKKKEPSILVTYR